MSGNRSKGLIWLMAGLLSSACATTGKAPTTARSIPVAGPIQPEATPVDHASLTGNFAKDRAAILKMAGEFRITFQFRETVAIKKGYTLKAPYFSKATEVVLVIEDTGRKIDLQHVLQVKGRVIKHWRQTWTYEDRTHFEFRGTRTWVPRKLSASAVKGTWTQRVYQVDDSPRYAGVGRWHHVGNLSSWQARAWRPLPRREYTKRSDYQVLVARNRQTITTTGWVHEQDNYKLTLDPTGPSIIAREVGLNIYTRVKDVDFSAARTFWNATKDYWRAVRKAWDTAMSKANPFKLKKVWSERLLYRHIFRLAAKLQAKTITLKAAIKQLHVVVDNFVITPPPKK